MFQEKFTMSGIDRFGKDGCFTDSFRFSVQSACSDCMVVTASSRYEGENAPQIRFFLIRDGAVKPIYESHLYTIGKQNEWTRQQWRVPPMFHPALHAEIEIIIPEGTKLMLREFHNSYGNPDRWKDYGVRFNAHLGFTGTAPANSPIAVELAAQSGFSTCIINPKEIADGELVCMHDSLGGVAKYARQADGSLVDDERSIYEMTYPEMDRWDYGLRKDEVFRGTRLLKLEDFFAICSKTGMKPMFSAHQGAVRISGWLRIQKMLQKYNLTPYLHVKAPCMEVLELAYSIFGDSIDGYTLNSFAPEKLAASPLAEGKCRLVIEPMIQKLNEDLVHQALDYGFQVSAFNLKRTSMEEYKKAIDWGITEFTEDHHCSMGLNW
ncbi:MAG: hypothetical protein IKC50_03920 [Oscillospiraceae bacterium]|nr:hypothetical protein [Oscillospiraceae bacterium]